MQHDLIGIGFGPSNVALAIALDEKQQPGRRVQSLFIERQTAFAWHPDMVLAHAHMQISFLKDLATLRNPRSRFTFVNYLLEKGRLQDFINLKTFFPSRHEFNDYFAWAAAQFEDRCAYGEEVTEVLPDKRGDEVVRLRVRSRNRRGEWRERLARHLVVSVGGTARIPQPFASLKGDPRVFHSQRYASGMANHGQARKIAVIGAGQSAAEIFMDLHGRPQAPDVDLVMRARSIRPSDDSPFVNEIFNAEFVDHMFSRSACERSDLLREFRQTNYACADLSLIEQIFKVMYEQNVRGDRRHRFLRRHEVRHVAAHADGIHLTCFDLDAQREHTVRYDAVVLATGYERKAHEAMLAPLAPYLGNLEVDRQYRVRTSPKFQPSIFLQGTSEASHGLSDTLLSVTAVRSGEIGDALLQANVAPSLSLAVGAT